MKILVPIDGSDAAGRAIDALLAYVPRLREAPQLELIFVSLPVTTGLTVHGMAVEKEIIEGHHRNETESALASARQRLESAGMKFGVIGLRGDPPEEICKRAQEGGFDMIWMGTRGMGNFANLILGSVATKVLHRARVPVVMVPVHPEPPHRMPLNDFRT